MIIESIIEDCAQTVFNELGSGHSEAVYESAMIVEMGLRDIEGPIMRQVPCPIVYRGYTVGVGYIDLVIQDSLVVELKTVAKLSNKDEIQVRKYLLGSGLNTGLLINFSFEDKLQIRQIT
jgi:GxxExxY protein